MRTIEEELNRLNFEDWLFIIVIALATTNIFCNQLQKKYLESQNKDYLITASTIFIIGLIISVFVYLYFVERNYNLYKESSKENKVLFKIKLLGSILLVVGILLLIYFQINDPNLIGAPAI